MWSLKAPGLLRLLPIRADRAQVLKPVERQKANQREEINHHAFMRQFHRHRIGKRAAGTAHFRHQMHEHVGGGHPGAERDDAAAVADQRAQRVHAPSHQKDGGKQQRRSARFDDCVWFEVHGHNNLKATATKRKTLRTTIRAAMIKLGRQIGTLW